LNGTERARVGEQVVKPRSALYKRLGADVLAV
jgi:hypothetical protein